MKTFYIKTLGCKVNQYESDGIAAGLAEKGLIRAGRDDKCDVCIINTCAVTSKAGMQSRQAIRKIARDNPGARIIVTGCHAQTDPDTIGQIPHIDEIICQKDKTRIADRILAKARAQDGAENRAQDGAQNRAQDNAQDCGQAGALTFRPVDHGPENRFRGFDKPVHGSMTRAYLKIQDGCDAFCTYCIVPYARGSSVSMPAGEVFRHLAGLSDAGFREVILTGIHTGMYGRDLSPQTSLADLMDRINQERPVHRIRLSSIEPNELDDRLIRLAGPDGVLCDHFHVPLQSGDDDVLKRMKRPYSAALFEDVILRIHEALPFAGIGVDTLIGFPGETDAQFENTFRLMERLPVSYLHVFPFSPRKGTPAFHFKPRVLDAAVKERCSRMRELSRQKRAAFIRNNLGRPLEGLVQHTGDRESGRLKAVTSNYLTVFLDKNENLKGKIVDLLCEQCDSRLNIFGNISP